MDNDAETRRKATEYGGWVGDTILRLLEERDAARAAYAEALKQMAALQEVYVQVYTERDALREALVQAQPVVCAHLCATVWKTGTERPHDRLCVALRAALDAVGVSDEAA